MCNDRFEKHLIRSYRLRAHPNANLQEEDAKEEIKDEECNFYDTNCNSEGFFRTEYVVIDHATGLVWQSSGSHTKISTDKRPDVDKYIQRLCERTGKNWRLPTLIEGMSLMEKVPQENIHLNKDFFDNQKNQIWTSDEYTDYNGKPHYWGIDYLNGEHRQASGEKPIPAYVRAVMSVDEYFGTSRSRPE